MSLFSIPHAGGSGYPYTAWRRRLPESVTVFGVRLPGRGPRITESPYRRMEPLASALCDAMTEKLDGPFVMFGHSMGALIAFEVCSRLQQRGFSASHLIVSGAHPPHRPRGEKQLHLLPRNEFLQAIKNYRGIAAEIFEEEELVSMFVPILRADFELVETYPVRSHPPVACPITAFGGEQDHAVNADWLQEWSRYTSSSFRRQMFPGGHFFISTHEKEVLSAVNDMTEGIPAK
ncbi:thioesterase II family protein [Dyella flagellata]|uniref:thioesterase II family protein n=1 Tax=Dyella flagellata TaxID=1867833 RepID=UPI0024E04B6D|nr:alpha/beta fold hydrolase [Dyella flagellata]